MPDLLLELFSEEIPARMQARAADDLKRLVTDALVDAGLTYDGAVAFVTPRRLTLSVSGLPARQPDLREERKGPRVGAPDRAIAGFLQSAGLDSLDKCEQREDRKGAYWVALIDRPGEPAEAVIARIVPDVIGRFPWPKSMRWGDGQLRWVRPLHGIVCLFGPETEETEVVDFAVDGVRSGNVTYGHRFMAGGTPITVRRFDDYARRLAEAKVMLDPDQRIRTIATDARNLAFAQGYELVEDEALLAENAGLVEWPVVLMGSFDEAYLALPPEVVRLTIRQNQKCFVMRGADGRLANRFIVVANIEAADGGKSIVAGNERVIAARLSDARFFWEQDRKTPLADRLDELAGITFHAKLGTQRERVERIERLAAEIAKEIGADVEKTRLAARLAKVDLVTGMVGEFPELQGIMGYYYALEEGIDREVAEAIRDHYKPQGPSDGLPQTAVGQAVALADKLDMLVGFWAIDEKPTGSKDPFALRRAALGVIRIVLENSLRLELSPVIESHGHLIGQAASGTSQDLLAFFADRLKVHLRERGARHDLIDAVFSLGGQDDLVTIVRRVEALGRFLDTEDGANLLTGYRRAANILRIEEKKDGRSHAGAPDPALFAQAEEKALASAIDTVTRSAANAVGREDFEAAMAELARLRAPVDAYFDTVTVNAEDPALRDNRLKLLSRIREAIHEVADFSRIEG